MLLVSTSQDSVSGTRHLVDLRSVSSVYLQSQAEVSRVDWIGNRRVDGRTRWRGREGVEECTWATRERGMNGGEKIWLEGGGAEAR